MQVVQALEKKQIGDLLDDVEGGWRLLDSE